LKKSRIFCIATLAFLKIFNNNKNILDCDQSDVLFARIIFFCILLTAF